MIIRTWRWGVHPGRWSASLEDGFWYDDSNPQGEGDTSEEAVADLTQEMAEFRDELTTFLLNPKIERGVDQQ